MNVPKWPMINQANDRCLSIKMSEIISVLNTTTTNLSGHYLMSPLKWPKMAVAKIKMAEYFTIKIQVYSKWTLYTEIENLNLRWRDIPVFFTKGYFDAYLNGRFGNKSAILIKINGP